MTVAQIPPPGPRADALADTRTPARRPRTPGAVANPAGDRTW